MARLYSEARTVEAMTGLSLKGTMTMPTQGHDRRQVLPLVLSTDRQDYLSAYGAHGMVIEDTFIIDDGGPIIISRVPEEFGPEGKLTRRKRGWLVGSHP